MVQGQTTKIIALACAVAALGYVVQAQSGQAVNTWASIGAPQMPEGAAAAALADGRTLIAGGLDAQGAESDRVSLFDPAHGVVTPIGQLLAPRVGHTATVLADGRVMVIGGTVDGVVSADVELFDPASGSSALVASLSAPRTGHAAAALPEGGVLVVGGASIGGAVLANAEIVDLESGTVNAVPGAMQTPRQGASATTLIDGRVLVAGGNDGAQDLASGEMFDWWSGSFAPLDPDSHLSVPRSGHTALLLPHNSGVLIAGGTSNGAAVAATDVFVPAEFPDPYSYGMGRFAAAASMAAPRAGALSGPAGDNGFAFVAGGGARDAEVYRYATLKTDKDDYAPGERAIITGQGWQPGETVRLVFQEDPAVHDDYVLEVVADGQGNIYWDQWAPELHDLNVRFYLMASDSKSRAQMTFTDSNPQSISVATPTSVTVTQGGTAVFGTLTLVVSGNSNACNTTFSIVSGGGTGLHASTTPIFGANPLQTTGTNSTTSFSVQTTAATPAGTYTFGIAGTNSVPVGGQCQGSGPSNSNLLTLEVTAAAVDTTTTINAPAITYGQNGAVTVTVAPQSGSSTPTGDVSLSVNAGAAVTKALSSGSATFTSTDVAALATPNAGSLSLSASYLGATGFNGSGPVTGTLTVQAAPLTITATNENKTYGDIFSFDGTSPSEHFTVSGLVGTDAVTSVTLTSTGATATATVAGSPYTIVPSAAVGSGLDNYNISYVNGTLTVGLRLLTITATNQSKTYGDEFTFDGTAPSSHFTVATLVNGDTVTSTTLTSAGAPAGATVGSYPIVVSAAVGTGLANYSISYVGGSLTVNRALLTVTGKSATRPFGTPNSDLSQPDTIVGYVNGENASAIGTMPTCSTAATLLSPVGSYPVVCGGGAADNYQFAYVNGTLTITGWHLTGFYQPVGGPNSIITPPGAALPGPSGVVWNSIKGGQTVPLKFEIFTAEGGIERTSVADIQSFTLVGVGCTAGPEDPVEPFPSTGGTSLRYDAVDGQFVQNWQSPKGANQCYRTTMTAADGTHISAFFRTK